MFCNCQAGWGAAPPPQAPASAGGWRGAGNIFTCEAALAASSIGLPPGAIHRRQPRPAAILAPMRSRANRVIGESPSRRRGRGAPMPQDPAIGVEPSLDGAPLISSMPASLNPSESGCLSWIMFLIRSSGKIIFQNDFQGALAGRRRRGWFPLVLLCPSWALCVLGVYSFTTKNRKFTRRSPGLELSCAEDRRSGGPTQDKGRSVLKQALTLANSTFSDGSVYRKEFALHTGKSQMLSLAEKRESLRWVISIPHLISCYCDLHRQFYVVNSFRYVQLDQTPGDIPWNVDFQPRRPIVGFIPDHSGWRPRLIA